MAKWIVPRLDSDMKKNGGSIEGDSSFQAQEDNGCTVKVEAATATSVLKFNGNAVSGQKTVSLDYVEWVVDGDEFKNAINATTGEASVEVECTNVGVSPNLYLGPDNHFFN